MGSRPTPSTTLAALALLVGTYALETPVTAAKLQWQQPVRQTTVALLTETEDAMQSAHAMWPVAVAMNDMLDGVGGDSVIAALPFATGAECRTFGLRRYVRAGAAGFKMASLLKLADTKAFDRETSALEYLVGLMMRNGDDDALARLHRQGARGAAHGARSSAQHRLHLRQHRWLTT